LSKTLTPYYKKFAVKKKKKRFKSACVLGILFVFVVMVAGSLGIRQSKMQNFDAKDFFIVYTGKYILNSQATEACTKVSDKGGAGVVYSVENNKFVVASIYFNQTEATKVQEKIKTQFSEANILKISAPKLSRNTCKEIEKTAVCKLFYNSFYEFCQQLYTLTIKFDTSEVSESDVYKKILKSKQFLSDCESQLKKQNGEVCKLMQESNLVLVEQIDGFFSSVFISNNVAKYLKKLYVNSVIEFVNMCKTIK